MKVFPGPSSASTAIWWCHTVRTQVGLLEPLPSLTSPKTYPAYGRRGSPDHSSSPKFPTSAPRLRPNKSVLSRLSGSTRRKRLTAPTLPSLAAWCMSLPRGTGPTPWELLEGARLVKAWNKKNHHETSNTAWILFFCQPGDEDDKANLEAQNFQHIEPSKKMLWKINLRTVTNLTQQKATCSPLSEFNNLRSWQLLAAALSALTGKNANCFAENCFAKF